MTVRLISRAGTQVGLSDPVVPNGWAIAQEIKVTLGIKVVPWSIIIIGLKSRQVQEIVKLGLTTCSETLVNKRTFND